MKNKNILALALLCGFSFSQVSFADSETVIYNKEGITVNLIADGEGTFKISVENKSSKDMVGVKVKTEDIKGLKIVKGKELEIGDVKVGEKKVLENEKIQFEVVEAIKDGIKKGKLSKTGIAGVYKINVTIAVAGIVGVICVLVSKKRNAKKLLSVAVGTGILMSSVLTYNSNAEGTYKNSANLSGNIEIKGKTYDYVGVLMWNDENSKVENDEQDKVVEIEDANLKKFILDKLHSYNGEDSFEAEMNEYNFKLTDKSYRKDKNSNEIYKSDLEKIEALAVRGMDAAEENLIEVSSIKGLEYCKNLKTLTISSGEIPDDNEEIRYSKGAIKDLTPLSNLKKLELLRLSHNEISDVSPLKDLTGLKYLYISHNNISDIISLKNLANLESFDFAVNKITDMSIVENFKNLKLLDIYSNKISNINYIKELEKLTYFRADSNNIENIDALKNLKLLEDLDLGNNKLKDTSVLNGLINLKKLSLKGNNIENLNLNKLINLDDLNIENNKISDISFLKNSTKLANLNLKKNNIENIDNVSGLTKLTYLNLSDNLISNVEPLKSLTKLSSLYLSNNKISDISSLKNLNELSSIKLDGNKIKDFSSINDKKGIFEKIIHNQNVDLGNVEVSEKTFEIDNVFLGLEKIAKGGNIKVSTEAEGVTVTLESGKLNFSLTDKAMENIKEGLKLTVKFKFENEMDYENNPTVLNLNVNLVKPAKKYVEIEDAKLLKVINKNLLLKKWKV